MTKWFAIYSIHDYNRFRKYGDMITCINEANSKENAISEIQKGDTVVFYCIGVGLIVGIFDVRSQNPFHFIHDNTSYSAKSTRRIRGSDDEYLDFKALASDSVFAKLSVETMLENKQTWAVLDEKDYEAINQAYSNPVYLRKIENKPNTYGETGWIIDPNVSCGLLDYYNSRVTSSVILFAANLLGLAVLAAIIQSFFSTNSFTLFNDFVVIGISLLLYVVLIHAGYHTLKTYFHYIDLSDHVKSIAIDMPYAKDLEKMWKVKTVEGKSEETNLRKIMEYTGLYHEVGTKRHLSFRQVFAIAYIAAFALIAIIIYWNVLPPEIQGFFRDFYISNLFNR